MTSDVAVRLAKARAAFQKAGDFKKVKTDGLKFAYLPIEAAKPVIEEVTSAAGITILPLSYEIIPEFTFYYEKVNKYDGTKTKWLYQTADVTFSIMGPEDSIELVVRAEAQDNSDKCINKVYTMAYKNLVKIVFGFAESSKDDADATQVEIPAEAKRVKRDASGDGFFGRKDSSETAPAPKPAPSKEIVTDRPVADMRAQLKTWNNNPRIERHIRETLMLRNVKTLDDLDDQTVGDLYYGIVKTMREAVE